MDIVRSCYKSIGEQQRPWSSKHVGFGLKLTTKCKPWYTCFAVIESV